MDDPESKPAPAKRATAKPAAAKPAAAKAAPVKLLGCEGSASQGRSGQAHDRQARGSRSGVRDRDGEAHPCHARGRKAGRGEGRARQSCRRQAHARHAAARQDGRSSRIPAAAAGRRHRDCCQGNAIRCCLAARAAAGTAWTARPWVHPSVRLEQGRLSRKRVPRTSHATFEPHPGRDPIAILAAPGGDRLQDLVPLRHARMAESPFAYYRGTPAVMAFDLADHPPDRHHRAGERRRPPVQLRHLRVPGADAWSSMPTTSTRRCPRPGNGTSSGSRRASSSPAARTASGRAEPRRHDGDRPLVSRLDGALRLDAPASRSGTRPSPSTPSAPPLKGPRPPSPSRTWPAARAGSMPCSPRRAARTR